MEVVALATYSCLSEGEMAIDVIYLEESQVEKDRLGPPTVIDEEGFVGNSEH